MLRHTPLLPALLLVALIASARPAAAAWPHDPNTNVPVSTAANYQYLCTSISDGAGGAIIVWEDLRGGSSWDIYAQRVSAAGTPLWTTDGIAVCAWAGDQLSPVLVSDGAGGAIITWYDMRSGTYDIYAQRINSTGSALWAANGVAVCAAALDQTYPAITTDGAGGAIITWQDNRSSNYDIYAQRMSAAGTALWAANGVALCTATGNQNAACIVSDGAGGAYVAWQDIRAGNSDVYAQRVNAAGTPQWSVNGLAFGAAAADQFAPAIVTDGASGAILAWLDSRSGSSNDVYAQRLLPAGSYLWSSGGVPVCTAANDQSAMSLVSDGAGGAILAWQDARSGTYDVYTQRLNSAGAPVWSANGVALCTVANDQLAPALTADGAGGAIVAWQDNRSILSSDVYAQRIGSTGTFLGPGNGVAVCTAAANQAGLTLAPDGAGGAIIAWFDQRSGSYYDIYAQRVDPFMKLGNPEPVISGVRDIPNDQGGKVRLSWDASWLDGASDPDLVYYDVFHSVPPNNAQQAIARGAARQLYPGDAPIAGVPSYLFSVQGYAWEYVQSYTVQHFITSYGSSQVTVCDSVAGSNPTTAFMVVARGYGGGYWMSAPVSGYSVDNLPPAAPAPFAGAYQAGASSLHWNRNVEADLAGYRLYRGTSTSFPADAGHLVAALADTGYTDAAAAPYIYKLTAIDSHGNESAVATLTPSGTADVGGASALHELALAPASPNPAARGTRLGYTLPVATSVTLAVYDAAGRRVRTLADGALPAGEHTAAWDLRDDGGRAVGAGLYFVRMQAGGRELTRRVAVTQD
jgi:hypothetical protein